MKKQLLAEFFGSAFLLMIVVGSGIMGETLAQGNMAVALLANSLATGAGLYVLILCLGPISGAHFNPVVTLTEARFFKLNFARAAMYSAAQVSGAIAGVFLTHVMFSREVFELSTKPRSSPGLLVSEAIATVGLLCTIHFSSKRNAESVPIAVAAYITAAYWFTSSTSFANPAVTIARMLTDTFCGIAPASVLPFIAAQFVGAVVVRSLRS